jgi:hypothetical protein
LVSLALAGTGELDALEHEHELWAVDLDVSSAGKWANRQGEGALREPLVPRTELQPFRTETRVLFS